MNRKEQKLIIKQIKAYIADGNTPEEMWVDAQAQGINRDNWDLLVDEALKKPSKLPFVFGGILIFLLLGGITYWYLALYSGGPKILEKKETVEETETEAVKTSSSEEKPDLTEETIKEEPSITEEETQTSSDLLKKVEEEFEEIEEEKTTTLIKPRLAPRTPPEPEAPSFNFIPIE